MVEFLILSACISGKGCPEATSAYYNYNHELQVWASREQKRLNTTFGKTNLAVVGTLAGVAFMRQGSFQVSNHVELLLGDKNLLQLHWETR